MVSRQLPLARAALIWERFWPAAWPLLGVVGLFLVGALSLALRRPFTLQYAREMTDPEIAALPDFVTANYVITSVWVAAFLAMVAANWLLLNLPNLPLWSGLVAAFVIRNPVLYFTKWYPAYLRRRSGPSPALNASH